MLRFWRRIRRNLHPRLPGRMVTLRPLGPEDLGRLSDWFQQTDLVSQAFGVRAEAAALQEMGREFLQGLFSGYKETLAIENQEGRLIGFVTYLLSGGQTQVAKIGILIGEETSRGRGYGTDALGALLEWLFNSVKVARCELDTASFNLRARRCFEKCGFLESGTITNLQLGANQVEEKVWMYLTREDYQAIARGLLE